MAELQARCGEVPEVKAVPKGASPIEALLAAAEEFEEIRDELEGVNGGPVRDLSFHWTPGGGMKVCLST